MDKIGIRVTIQGRPGAGAIMEFVKWSLEKRGWAADSQGFSAQEEWTDFYIDASRYSEACSITT